MTYKKLIYIVQENNKQWLSVNKKYILSFEMLSFQGKLSLGEFYKKKKHYDYLQL